MNKDEYLNVASFYDSLFEPLNKGLRELGIRLLPPKQGMKVLDAGCGTGMHLQHYQKAGCELFGIDSSPAMLDVARQRLGENADLRIGDASQLPYEDHLFDLAICMLVLHEMDQKTRLSLLGELKRVVKSDGTLLLIDFYTGSATSIKGWIIKPLIFLTELAAGRRHFRNFRHFKSIGGLPRLIEQAQLIASTNKVVAGGGMIIYLAKPA